MPHVRPTKWANVGFFVFQMPKNLVRLNGKGDLHFVTLFECRGTAMSLSRRRAAAERTLSAKTKSRAPSATTTSSCYRRLALLGTVRARNVFVKALEEVRRKYKFQLVGYVLMPEHVHLLTGESKLGMPSTVVHSLKLRVSKRMRREMREKSFDETAFKLTGQESPLPQFWQKRFYDFNVYSAEKRKEKLDYMHRNPVTRGLVEDPKDWMWSSFASYSGRGDALVEIDYVV